MKFGIWAPLPHTIRSEPAMVQAIAHLSTQGRGDRTAADPSFEFAADIITRAERCGFDITLIAERLMGPDLESWILASALAQRTRTIELMVAVHPGIVSPQMVAKMGASLDRISGGRFSVNIIAGWWKEEMNLFGNGAWIEDADDRSQRMGEFVDVMRGLWTEESLSYSGKYFQADKARLPIRTVQTPCPPIYAASRSPAGKKIVAQKCDVWFVEYQTDFRLYETNAQGIADDIVAMQSQAAACGRSLEYGISAHVICADTMEQAVAQAEELEAYGQKDRVALTAAKALGAGLVGTPEIIAERIKRYERSGVNCLMLRFHPMGQGLDTFAERVLPLLGKSKMQQSF